MMPNFVLFAVDWADIIVPVVVFFVWIVNQILGAQKKQQAGRPAPKPQPVQPANQGQRGLMDEVEQFLREARKAMDSKNQPAAKPAPPQQERKPPPRPQQKPKQKPPKLPQQKARVPLAEQQNLRTRLEERDEIERGGSVDEHVRRHLDTSRFDERAGRLSHLQQTVDQDIGAHVKSAFDHKVGSLAEQSAAAPTEVRPNPAAQIAALLSDPASIRNAVVLQEILTPPSHRW